MCRVFIFWLKNNSFQLEFLVNRVDSVSETHGWACSILVQQASTLLTIHFSHHAIHFQQLGPDHWAEQQTQTKEDNRDGTLSTVSSARPLNRGIWAQNGCHATIQLVDAQHCCGWSKLVTHAGYNSPLYSPKRGIMQTEQAGAIKEHLDGFCCGKLEGKVVDVGTITAHNNKVYTVMFVCFLVSSKWASTATPLPTTHAYISTWNL